LKGGSQKAVAEIFQTAGWDEAAVEDDEAGKVLVFAA
jgi:hypothetical protein